MSIALIPIILLILVIGTFATVAISRSGKQETTPVPNLSKRSDKKRKRLSTLLLTWADRVDKHGVGSWLRQLSPSDLATLTKDVDIYARDMGFDLLWMLDQQIDDVALFERVNHTVFKYVQSFFLASSFQDDMERYKVLVDFLNNMDTRRYRPKAEAIYRYLDAAGAVPTAEVDLLFKRRKTRIQFIEESIRKAAQTHRHELNAAIRDVIILT